MASYKVIFRRSAERDLRKIEKSQIPIIFERIESLEDEPRPVGVRKIVGSKDSYRIRIGKYRVIYTIEETVKIVGIDRIGHRKDVYKKK